MKRSLLDITAEMESESSAAEWRHEFWYTARWEVPHYSVGISGLSSLRAAREQCEEWQKGKHLKDFKTYVTRMDTITRMP